MSHRPIIDAGPGLNFLSIHKERLLIGVLGPLCTPETVQAEVFRGAGATAGQIKLVSTLTVLQRAAGGPHVPSKAEMADIYRRLRGLDDGLPPIETTDLLSPALWW